MMFRFLIASAIVLSTQTALAQAPTPAERYAEGQRAYDAGRFDDAIRIWEDVYAETTRPAILWNLGIAYFDKGDCPAALDRFRRFFASTPDASQEDRNDFALYEKACEAKLTPQVKPEAAPTERRDSQQVIVTRGAWRRPTGIGLAGGGMAAVALGLYFGHRADSLADEVTRSCRMGCDWSVYGPKDADGRKAETFQWVSYGTGAALIGAGVALYLWGTNTTQVHVAPMNNGVTGAVSWTW